MALRFPVSSVLLVFVFLFLIYSTGDAFSKVICQGDPCTINGSPGSGTYMKQCKSVLNAFRRGSPPLVVGYYFFEPIVCCPLNESSPTTTTETTPQPSSAATTTETTPQPSSAATTTETTPEPSSAATTTETTPEPSSAATTTETTPPPSSTTTTTPIQSPEAIAERECNRYNRPSGMYKVIGGKYAKKNEYPHMAAMYINNAFICGGSLISERYVLTAAHCFKKTKTTDQIHVVLGVLNLTTVENDINAIYQIINKTEHPKYNKSYTPAGYDIALLELETNVTFNTRVFPACLAYSAAFENYSIDAEVSGWGITEEGEVSYVLLGANVPLVPIDKCKEYYNVTSNMHLCAGANGNDTCRGDSGGPLSVYRDEQKRHFLIGITSFGADCTDPEYRKYNIPGVYTKVSSYIDWIQSIVWPN